MNDPAGRDFDRLSPGDKRRVDVVADQFEQAVAQRGQPDIATYLAKVAVRLRRALFSEVLAIEIEYLRADGRPPARRTYQERWPEYARIVDEVFDRSVSDDPGSTDAPGEGPDQPPPDLTPLTEWFQFKELIGKGGMGWVYLAQRKGFHMNVAVKVVAENYSTNRFRGEAETLANLKSKNIVTIHDFQILPNGTPYLVMEYVDGGDLSHFMRSKGGKITEHDAIRWMRQTCEGMRSVAEKNIVHRDLKPSNVMTTKDGTVKVADFGLAHAPRPSEYSDPSRLMGTVYYMSPEQAEDPDDVDTRSDIYSFGACFYHALTGFPPFDGPTNLSILRKHAHETPVSPRSLNDRISEEMSQLLERCLAKSRDQRFQSFNELLNYLETAPWNMLEDQELSEYVATYQSRRADYLARRRGNGQADVYTFPNGRKLEIVVGNIVDQDVLAIVSADDWLVSMNEGFSREIRRAAGDEVRDEILCAPVRPGRVVVTSGGNLKAQRIFHGVLRGYASGNHPPSRDIISEVMGSAFYQADSYYVTSLAFPLIGTDMGQFPEDVCLDTMFRFLARQMLRSVTAVRTVRIVLSPAEKEVSPDGGRISSASDGSHVRGSWGRAPSLEFLGASAAPKVPGYAFFQHYAQARYTAGDLLDFLRLSPQRLAIVIANVLGHGLGGTLAIRTVSRSAKSLLADEIDLADAAWRINRNLFQMGTERFVNMILAVLDTARHEFTFVNAGQPSPLLRRIDGTVEIQGDDVAEVPLAIEKNVRYHVHRTPIARGEQLIIATDGILKASNPGGEPFGARRLGQMVATHSDVDSLGASIVRTVERFQRDLPATTDWSLVCLGRD